MEFDDSVFFPIFLDIGDNSSDFVNREDTNPALKKVHLSVVQSSGHLADIVIAVVAITYTIALATHLILRGRWFRKHDYPSEMSF